MRILTRVRCVTRGCAANLYPKSDFPCFLPDKADCDHNVKNGCETDIFGDQKNCGKCGAVCEEKYGYDTVCKKGQCDFACKDGYADCNYSPEDGCEAYVGGGDVKNCGACGKECEEKPGYYTSCEHDKCVYVDKCINMECPKYPYADATCHEGKCSVTCSPGYADCNDKLEHDGCEVNVDTDYHNCGACGKECEEKPGYDTSCEHGKCVYVDKCTKMDCPKYPDADATCHEGKCTVTCSPGCADCNGDMLKDGCEVKMYTDKDNCGGCGKACPGKFSSCIKGICKGSKF